MRESTILNTAYRNYLREVKGSTLPDHCIPTFKLSTKNKERQVKQKIMKYLSWVGYYCIIVVSSAHYNKDAGQYVRSETSVGAPDLVACIDGQFVGIEVKRKYATGQDRQSDIQKKVEARLNNAGGRYIIVSDFMDMYNQLFA